MVGLCPCFFCYLDTQEAIFGWLAQNCVFFFFCSMSSEMVACIAVESLSILEKMHSRGYWTAFCFFLSYNTKYHYFMKSTILWF